MNEHFYDNHPEFPPMWDDEPMTEEWIATQMEIAFVGDNLSFGDRMLFALDHMSLVAERQIEMTIPARAYIMKKWAINPDDAQSMWEDHLTFTAMWERFYED